MIYKNSNKVSDVTSCQRLVYFSCFFFTNMNKVFIEGAVQILLCFFLLVVKRRN